MHLIDEKPKSPSEARALGTSHYFTGRPCKYGHISIRYLSTGACAECSRIPKTGKEARARGLTYYFTGKPCKNGHIAKRFANNAGCMECQKEWVRKWHQNNPESAQEWNRKNREHLNELARKWRKENPERAHKSTVKWAKKNRHIMRDIQNRRRVDKRASPAWRDKEKIYSVYLEQERLIQAGLDVHVDHIVPLEGENVCGLHVEYNLQIMTASANYRKKNKHDPMTHVHELPTGDWEVRYHSSIERR